MKMPQVTGIGMRYTANAECVFMKSGSVAGDELL